jgi:hypothetical protein
MKPGKLVIRDPNVDNETYDVYSLTLEYLGNENNMARVSFIEEVQPGTPFVYTKRELLAISKFFAKVAETLD